MTLVQLRCFYTVASIGSFSKAADQLFLSQPSVSKHIAQLEQELQIKLLNRLNKSVVLTQEGRRMFQHCRDIFMTLQHMEDDAAKFRRRQGQENKLIRFSGVPTMSLYGIVTLINDFIRANPDHDVLVEELDEDKVLFNLQLGSCDIAYCSDIKLPPDRHKHIQVCTEEFCAVFARKYWPDDMEHFSLTDLWGVPLILNRQESMLYDHCCDACRAAGFEPHVKMQSSRPEIAMEYVLSHPCCYIGLHQAALPFATENHCVRVIKDMPSFNYVLAWPKNALTPAAKRFVAFARPYLASRRLS